MANHPSAKKRHRQNLKRNERNSAGRSKMRHALKTAHDAVSSNADNKAEVVKNAVREIYRASSKNILKARTASRHVSRLMRQAAR